MAGLQSFNRRKERNSDELFSSYTVWVTSAAAEIDIEVGGSIGEDMHLMPSTLGMFPHGLEKPNRLRNRYCSISINEQYFYIK
jgi:hypothetical protein